MGKVVFVSSTVQAGFPSTADDHIEKKLDLNELLIHRPAATFFVRVEGESMVGANIHTGDILIVDRSMIVFSKNSRLEDCPRVLGKETEGQCAFSITDMRCRIVSINLFWGSELLHFHNQFSQEEKL